MYLVVLRSSAFSIAAVAWRSGTSSSASSSPTRTTPGRVWSRRRRSLRWCPRASSTATSSSRPSFSTESWKCRPPLSDSTTSKTFQQKTFPRKKHFLHFETLVFCHIYQILSSSVSLLRKPNVCELCILFLRRWTQPAKKFVLVHFCLDAAQSTFLKYKLSVWKKVLESEWVSSLLDHLDVCWR